MNSDLGKTYLEVNTYKGNTYFSKDRFDDLVDFMTFYVIQKYSIIDKKILAISGKSDNIDIRITKKIYVLNQYLKKLAENSKYLFKDLLDNLGL